jgi:hypothetical protein
VKSVVATAVSLCVFGSASSESSQASKGTRSATVNQAFNADKSVNHNENLDRCFFCHKLKAQQDFMWSFER